MGSEGRRDPPQGLGAQVERAAHQVLPGLALGSETLAIFEAHAALIARWSARVRLVGNPSPEALVIRHFVDSLTVSQVAAPREGMRALDVGSGAGFPGLVLAALWPQVKWQLLEVDIRKAAFLNAAVGALGMVGRVQVIHRAAEGDPRKEGVSPADLVISRAVRGPEQLLDWLSPYLAPGGRLVGMLGPTFAGETALQEEASVAGLHRVASWAGELPEDAGHRTVVAWGR